MIRTGDWVTVAAISDQLLASDGQPRTEELRTPATLDRLGELWLWRVGLVVAVGTVPKRPELTSYRVLVRQGQGWGTPELLPEEIEPAARPADWKHYIEQWNRIQRLKQE